MDYRSQHQQKSARSVVYASVAGFVLVFLLWNAYFRPVVVTPTGPVVTKAVAVLNGNTVKGTVTFSQSSPTGPVKITGKVTGLDQNAKRGFHVHAFGDVSGGCASTGSHFNPAGVTHGAPSDAKDSRHVGDLGNILSDNDGVATLDFGDALISLTGPNSIVGRAVVVHEGTDDLGRGDSDESLKTGNAGGRAACGVIGLTELA
ncbi:hypothetical protein PUNSTDRAFT_97816 [Punctularia strigosozonata HHB-11173 SS5]|uniref:uncharacterized protein n=1 Tax=Punctularia strigosozonata (strain HHB-11173) TaxID=741275 RepID=UPI00044167B2|nr:uncharacterized protein PUNSTDRAFT_97816 [Punctularia strigosozonata HHB-11173 SS5]EIN12873.1 hypothetical protein PUNSTDRAFT_97816 [Punctularia strigosozonata HHB-11173 SS5]